MMAVPKKELLRVWSMRFSAATAVMVVLLSWLNGVQIQGLMVRAGISFGLIYLLTFGTLNLFDRMAPSEPQEEQPSSSRGRGDLIDFSVGAEELQKPQVPNTKFAGQVDQELFSGQPDSKRQAEIVRRMGWE